MLNPTGILKMDLSNTIELLAAKPNRSVYQHGLNNKLQHSLDMYESGQLTARRFETRIKSQLARAYEEAYAQGSGGYIDEDYIQTQLEKEYGFLRSMFRDIHSEQLRMPLSQRLGMYADKVGSIYYAGRVRENSQGKNIIWNLGATDQNCEDCIKMANGSPYSPKRLKTYPGAGDTKCLTNCQCWLEFE